MYTELTNLLSSARTRSFRRSYFFRFGTLTFLMLAVVVLVHGIFLLPSYIYAQGQVMANEKTLSHLNATLGTSEERQVNMRLATLRTDVATLSKLKGTPTASAPLRAVLALPRPGIILTGFTVTPASAQVPNVMTVSGIASSRDALRNYDTALGGLSFVTNADLPISAYAKEQDIPFTITLSGTLLPTP